MKAFSPQRAAMALTALIMSVAAPASFGASHRDAPGQLSDPDANITDVYAFVNSADTVTLAFNVHPFIDPDSGPIWPFFSPDVLYELHVKNNPTIVDGNPVFSGSAQISYQFRFSPPAFQNPNTALTEGRGGGLDAGPINRVGDGRQNMIQTYSVTRVNLVNGERTPLESDRPMIVPPPNVGAKATPLYNDASGMALPGATTEAGLDQYTKDGTYNLGVANRRVFAGMREDGFYFDQGGTFDLLNLRSPGIDTFTGLNVLSIVLQVPKTDIVAAGGPAVIGVYATSSRRMVTVRRQIGADGRNPTFNGGSFQTVSRMGNPLFNEGFVSVLKKDRFNQTRPGAGDDAEFRPFAENPELAILINAVLFSSATPTDGPIKTTGRTDLSAIFIPDLLKLDTSTAPVRLAGQDGFSRLSVFGGDTLQSPFQNKQVASGWPNGRRFGDDVVDIALTALGSMNNGTGIFNTNPAGQLVVLSDNANANDVTYPTVFPYIGVPHSGLNHKHHAQPAPPAAPTQFTPAGASPTVTPKKRWNQQSRKVYY